MQWIDASDRSHVIDLDGLDPYAAWLIRDNGRFAFPKDFGEPRIYPITIELDISVAEFASGESLFDTDADRLRWRESIAFPPILTMPPANLATLVDEFRVTTAVAKQSFFEILREPGSHRARRAIRSLTISRPLKKLPSFDPKARETPPPFDAQILRQGRPSGSVVVGIIDDGIAFAHEQFRDAPNSTRISSIWLQSQQTDEHSPTLFGRGREITKNDIDKWLSAPNGLVDEDQIYREAGVLDFASSEHKSLARRAAHGTHVLDTATGPKGSSKPKWPIVCVQLPSDVTADTSGARLTLWALEGVWYILLQSLAIAFMHGTRPMPVVINLSYGFTAGPHDGGHPLERALQKTVEVWERLIGASVRIVLPAGNNLQSRLHARMSFDECQSVDLPWRVHPDDRTASHVEIWLPRRPSEAPCPVRVSVRPPGAAVPASPPIGGSGTTTSELLAEQQVLCQINYSHSGGPGGRGVVRVSIAPTYELEHTKPESGRRAPRPSPVAPHGIWTIRIENTGLTTGEEVHAWVQRDDTAFGYPSSGRQSFFDDPAYQRFDAMGDMSVEDNPRSLVKRAGTLNAIATGSDPRIMVVGAYAHAARRTARYSSRGPTLGDRRGPDALFASDRSRVSHGMLGAGTRSGSSVGMNGTSVAAPGVTRLIAEELAAGRAGDVEWLASIADALRGRLPEAAGAGTIPLTGERNDD
jgi:hypothetical protein